MKRFIICLVMGLLVPVYSFAQYNTINVISSSSSSRSSNKHVPQRIDVKVGRDGEWTFIFSSMGTFRYHVWYGKWGKFSTEGEKRKESYGTGTYSIEKEDGKIIVYLYYSNGYQETGELEYKGGRVVLRIEDCKGCDTWKKHKELDE